MTTTTALPLAAGAWTLDPAHSSVGFTIRHLGVSKVRGRFNRFSVDAVVGDSLETSSVAAVIHVDSVDTGIADRDAHILQPDMVDVSLRPTITFTSRSIEADGEGYVIEGDATIGAVTGPLRLQVELGGVQDFADGTRHAGFEARGELRRSDFGIAPAVPSAMLGDVLKIELDLQLVEPR